MLSRKLAVVVFSATAVVSSAFAQTTAQTQTAAPAGTQTPAATSADSTDGGTPTYVRPETAEQRKLRVGPVDPGLNPDQNTEYYRYGKRYHIYKYERRWAAYDNEPGYVRPFAFVNSAKEIYQQNEKFVWTWEEIKDAQSEAQVPVAAPDIGKYTPEAYVYLKKIQPEFTPLSPASAGKRIRFEESSSGLPTAGSWRNGLTIADMNNDGFPDIVTPPQRGGGGVLPAIFLGDGKGNWKIWSSVVWPYGIQYGTVAAADFNKDGNMDLAFAVHLSGVRVWLGDGKGNFTDSSKGLPMQNYPTRRLVVTDLDQDGWPDVLAVNEGPTSIDKNVAYGKAVGFLNKNKGAEWTAVAAADPKYMFAGDWLSTGNFNKDKYPDFLAASIYFQASQILYLSKDKGKWDPVSSDGDVIPYLSYYFANAAGPFSSKKTDDAILSFIRFWPQDADASKVSAPAVPIVSGVDRITFTGSEPKRVPIMRWAGNRGVTGMATGDLDGDGNLDVAFTRFDPRELVILLGDGNGGFKRAEISGLMLEAKTNYDLKIADVNGDGRPDVILMYESGSETRFESQNGSIHVYLNRGGETVSPAAAQ
ncbi:MAG: VCBS repeat-containing protein [Acidobacteria bacterium]|nr:VCBS repeat-containing protein [Acidobacteriota bacterium]